MTYFQTLKILLKWFKNYIWNFRFYLFISIWFFVTIIGSVEPFFISKAISYVENYSKTWDINTKYVINFFIFWILFIIISALIRYYYRFYQVEKNIIKYYIDEAKRFKEKILYMSEWAYLNKKWWSIYKILDRWIEWIFFAVLILFYDIFPSIITVIFVTIVVFVINIKMAIATVSIVPILIFIWYYFNSKTYFLQENVNMKWNSFYWKIWDYFTNLTLVKTLTFEKSISKELDDIHTEAQKLQTPLSKRWSIANIYSTVMINLARFMVLLVWIYLIKTWEISFSTLFLYFAYINYLYYPLWFMFEQLRQVQKQLEWIKNMYEEFGSIEQDIELENSKNIEKVIWKIEFNNVSFNYVENIDVLKNINFTINPWEKVALVWNTWSWKSTITKLLLRLFEINKWEILLDWVNIKNITKKSLREHIWIVMQDNTLFNTTILDNLKFAKQDATNEELHKSLKKSKADFVFETSKWLNSVIWERWLKLSWWEKQRISIARIFLKDPKILILDEATSALDNKTEKQIQASLDELIKWKTSIIIAHRLSTIKKVDKIFVLENWKIVETWNYEELMNLGWKFYELANPDKLIMS